MLTGLLDVQAGASRRTALVVSGVVLALGAAGVMAHVVPLPLLVSLLLVASAVGWLLWRRRQVVRIEVPIPANTGLDHAAVVTDIESLFEASPAASLLIDAKDSRIVKVNAAATALYRCEADSLCGRAFEILLAGRVEAPAEGGLAPRGGRQTHQRADGIPFQVELAVSACRLHGQAMWLVVVSDVSESERLRRELEVRERELNALTELSSGIVIRHDLAGTVLDINPAALRLLGFTREDLLGLSLGELLVAGEHATLDIYLQQLRRNARSSGVFHLRARNGNEHALRYRNVVSTQADGSDIVLCCAAQETQVNAMDAAASVAQSKGFLAGEAGQRQLARFEADTESGAGWTCVVVDIELNELIDSVAPARDRASQRMARMLERMARSEDTLIQRGERSFAILIRRNDQATLESFAVRLETARQRFSEQPFAYGMAVRRDAEDIQHTLLRADRQLNDRRTIERNALRKRERRTPASASTQRAAATVVQLH